MRKESLYQWNRDKLRKIPIIGALLARDRVKAKQVSRFFFDVLCLFMAGSMISCAVHPLTSIKQLHPTSHKTTYINRDIFDYRPTEEYPRTIRSEDAELPLSHREFPSKLSSYHALSLNKLLLYPIEFPSQTRILMDGNPNIPDNLLKGAGGGSMVGFVAFLVAVLSIGECTERADEDGDGFKECTNYRDPTDKEKQILLYSFLIPAVGGTILGASWDIAEALEARQKRLRLKHPRLRGTLAIQGLLPEDALHAGEKAQLTIRLENSGNKSASDIALDLDFGNYEQYLKIPQIEKIKKLKPGKQQVIQVPIQANTLMPTGTVRITLAGRDKNGHLIQGEPLNIQTRERLYPAELVTNVTFSDETAFIPNRSLDATERGQLTVTVRNNGEGMGFDVKLKVNSDNPDVTVEEAKSLGNLAPNEEKTVTIPLQTSLQAKDGFANILVETKEKRGFDAQKQQIRIPVVHLSAPKLEIASIELNDRMLGRAQGNGIPENDETIELIAFIKNNGVGDAIAAKLELVEINSGLSMLERAMDLGIIRPNQTVKGTLLFHVPRLFSAEQLKYQLRVSEIRGVGTAEKTETIAMSARQPILAYSIRPPDVLHNGEQVAFELIPKNQGLLDARGVSVRLSASGASITPETFELGDIQAGTTGIERRVVVDLPRTYSQKQLTLQIQMTQSGFAEKSGTETYPVELLAPEFIVTDRFVDQNGNQVIEQGERVEVELTVTNRGRLEAQNVRLSVDTSVPDVRIAESQRLVGTLPPNTTSDSVKFIFTLPRTGRVAVVPDYGDFPITVTINQSEFQSVTHRLNYTIAPASPILGVTAQFVDQDKDGRIEQGEQVDVAVTVSNTGKQDALNAAVQLSTTTPNVVIEKKNQSIGTLSPNKSETVTFAVTIPRGVTAGVFPLEVKVTHAEFAPVVKPLNYTIHEAGVATTVVEAKQPSEQPQTPAIGNKPPTILPTNVTDNQTLYAANFELRVSVSDDRRLASVTAKLNGRPIYDSQHDPNAMNQLNASEWRMLNFTQPLTLQQGDNVLVISAVDSDNEREEVTLHLKYNPRATVISQISNPSDVDVNVPKGKIPQQNGVALVIGIEKYQHISKALYADRDAIAFRQYLIDLFGFKEENIVLLLNDEATKGGISRGLRKLSDWCETTSDVIVYYAGHGLPTADGKQQFLIPSDGDPNYLDDETAYNLELFCNRLSQLRAKSVTMFMDACFSGTDREENLIVDARPIFQVVEGLGAYPNLDVFASSAASELSASFPDNRHGMFTYYLLKGLRGEADLDKDGAIQLTEIEKFVQENVSREAKRIGREQSPTLMGQKKERVLVYPVQQ